MRNFSRSHSISKTRNEVLSFPQSWTKIPSTQPWKTPKQPHFYQTMKPTEVNMLHHVKFVIGGKRSKGNFTRIDPRRKIESIDSGSKIDNIVILIVQKRERLGGHISLLQTEVILPRHGHDDFFSGLLLVHFFNIFDSLGLLFDFLQHHFQQLRYQYQQVIGWIGIIIQITSEQNKSMISQIFILSARGDSIINRDFRSDLIKNTPELFYRKVKLAKGDCEPIFNIQGINFAYIRVSSLYVVATTRFNVSPSFILELLQRIVIIIRDFCGQISEEMIRKNFVLIYEILDETIDFGHPQLTNTSQIKPLIASEVVESKQSMIDMKKFGNFSLFSGQTAASSASNVSVSKNKANQIFVDIYEKINILFNASGYVINSSIDGCIQMKSYLTNNPPLKLILNEDIVMADANIPGNVVLDDCNFHQTVNYSEFLVNKSLRIDPSEGEFVAMNYRITSDFVAPFKLFAFFETVNEYKVELTIKLKSVFPKNHAASWVVVKFDVPKKASSITPDVVNNQGNQKSEFIESTNSVEWTIKKMPGETEYTLLTKINLAQASSVNAQRQTGPISLNFQIPMYNVSGFQIKSLKILQGGDDNPAKWVRYLTKSSSYVCRI